MVGAAMLRNPLKDGFLILLGWPCNARSVRCELIQRIQLEFFAMISGPYVDLLASKIGGGRGANHLKIFEKLTFLFFDVC